MPRFYEGAVDAMNAPFEPKTPCRNMPTRPCVAPNTADSKHYFTTECLPHQCARFEDRYEEGQIPHEWEMDAEDPGYVAYHDIDDNHGGPRCIRCEMVFCKFCEPDIWRKICGEQDVQLFSLQHIEKE